VTTDRATPGEGIELLYASLRGRGGQRAQLDSQLENADIAAAFAMTVADPGFARAGGPFFPPGSRTPLIDLVRRRSGTEEDIVDTEHLQALLWRPPRFAVAGRLELDFEFVAREIRPTSSLRAGKREWLTSDARRRISLDALLVNAEDRTPIVAELKVGSDENAELALVQALAAAAQLSALSQRRRLHVEYRDTFGSRPPDRVDVYVITSRAPERGVRPALAARAHTRATALLESGMLDAWIRRIVFLEASITSGALTCSLVHNGAERP